MSVIFLASDVLTVVMRRTLRLEQMLKSRDAAGMSTAISEFTYTVSEVARESGVAASAIRFYEKHDIITGIQPVT